MDIFDLRFDPTKARPLAVGIIAQVVGTDGRCRTYISAKNRVGSQLAVGQPVTIDYLQTYGCSAIANATTGSEVYKLTATALKVMPADDVWWFQTGGKGKGLVDGTSEDVAAGNALEVLNTGTAFIKAGAARDLSTGAIALEAQAANEAVLVDVELIPERHSIEGA